MSTMFDQLKTLTAAGKGKEARQLLEARASRAAREYDLIRSDASLSEAGKRQRLAGVATQVRREAEAEIAKLAARVIDLDRDDAGKVLGVSGLQGDPASLVISRRDAADRVAQTSTREELQELLRRATRSGDEVLARAVAEKALEELDAKTMNQFLADRPLLDDAANRLWNARQAETDGFSIAIQAADLSPHEFFGMDSDAVREIAEAEVSPEPATAGSPFAWGGGPT